MSDTKQENIEDQQESTSVIDEEELLAIGRFGVGLSELKDIGKGAKKVYKVWNGAQGDVNIIITNRLDKAISIQLISNDKDKKYERRPLKQGETAVQNVSSKAGIAHTTKLQCQFWIGQMNFTVHVYGDQAQRNSEMKYEVREQGVYWLNDTDEYCVYKFD